MISILCRPKDYFHSLIRYPMRFRPYMENLNRVIKNVSSSLKVLYAVDIEIKRSNLLKSWNLSHQINNRFLIGRNLVGRILLSKVSDLAFCRRFTITQITLCMLDNLFLLSLFLLLRNNEILIICFWFFLSSFP